eukprot:COSAG05_NODE_248_length_12946_cov_85.003737_3_plen_794_part_00
MLRAYLLAGRPGSALPRRCRSALSENEGANTGGQIRGGGGGGLIRGASACVRAMFSLGSKKRRKPALWGDEEVKRPPPAALLAAAPSAAPAAVDDVDPLDAFMTGVSSEVQQNKPNSQGRGEELETGDDTMDNYEHRGGAGAQGTAGGNSDDEVYATAKSADKVAANKGGDTDDADSAGLLPRVDHAEMAYMPFRRDFYNVHAVVASWSEAEVAAFKKEISVSVTWLTGGSVPRPIRSFAQAGFPRQIMQAISKAGYDKPTAIQSQAWPILLSGRDVIGIAKTGSGKTAAFVLPGLTHLMDQPELEQHDGPIMVVLAPTRELAAQIYTETKKFAKAFGLKVGAVYGGMSKFEQFKLLKNGVEAVVATPGRLIDLIKMKGTNMKRCTYIVLDEADRMLNMGFEAQVRSIMDQVRPNRHTAMFSATFRRAVEGLARDLLHEPVRVTIGSVGEANKDIEQVVEVLQNEEAKWMWLVDNIDRMLDMGQVLIFRGSKDQCDAMSSKLQKASYNSNSIHGDKDQRERDEIMKAFKSGHAPVLVATDVASRGLDIRGIKNVLNFDVARDIDSHVHRIGRTGRAGDKGHAFTLLDRNNPKDSNFAGDLVRNLEMSGQVVSEGLLALAMENPRFQQRQARGTGGLGFGGDSRGKGNAHRKPSVSGLGFVGSDGRATQKKNDKVQLATGIAFQKSSGGPLTSLEGGFVAPKGGDTGRQVQQKQGAMGMIAAQHDQDAFKIGTGGLVNSVASERSAQAAERFLESKIGLDSSAATTAAAPPGDWLAAAKAQQQSPQKRKSRWDK